MDAPAETVRYMNVLSCGPLIVVRTPWPQPKWKTILFALTKVMRSHGLRQKDISAVEGYDREYEEKHSPGFMACLDEVFAGSSSRLPAFYFYDWRDESFVLVRGPVEVSVQHS